jgi:hypothetical protein
MIWRSVPAFRRQRGALVAEAEYLDRNKRAEQLRSILSELAGLSANKAAAELNRRGVPTPQGGQWHALTVIRLRQRLA